MEAIIKIIEENIPLLTSLNLSHNCIQRLDELSELVTKVPHLKALNLSHNDLKSEHELDKLKGLKVVELWLVRNPLCDLFKDRSSYVRSVFYSGLLEMFTRELSRFTVTTKDVIVILLLKS
ncbi:nuclear RNA export factor 1-like [Gouania willdenowi]|uniref:nuclear RNA export factor 1-like n=1 Tax=Gouania willdenowi TaxID=441366 RepID=UPI001054E09F|nr:nuclear RNA export factor 1-like [Gouania willdenowi]